MPEPESAASTERLPRWVIGLAIVSALLAVLAVGAAYAWLDRTEGEKTCDRCGAVESGPEVLGVWLGTVRPASPGRRLFERVSGACSAHHFQASGYWKNRGVFSEVIWVTCMDRPTGERAYELCALAGGQEAKQLVAYLARLTPRVRAELTARSRESVGSETPEGARAWVLERLAEQGGDESGTR